MQNNDEQTRKYKGYNLFNSVKPKEIQANNRGAMMANIFGEFAQKDGRASPRALSLIMGYFQEIPQEERADAKLAFHHHAKERGFINE